MTNEQLGSAVFAQGWLETGIETLSTTLPLSEAEVEGFQTYFKILNESFDTLYRENVALQEKLDNVKLAL